MMAKKDRPRIALVIGSGSVKCAAALGLMKVFEREHIHVDMVVGCSGGAIYAALIALGWSVERATEATLRMWTREVTSKRSTRAMLQLVLPWIFKFDETFGLIDDSLINRRLRTGFGDTTFAQARGGPVRSWDPRLSTAGNQVSRKLAWLLDNLSRMENWLRHRGRGELSLCDCSILAPGFERLVHDGRIVAELSEDLVAEMKLP